MIHKYSVGQTVENFKGVPEMPIFDMADDMGSLFVFFQQANSG